MSTTSQACSTCGRLDYPHVCSPALGAIPTVATGVVQCRVVYRVFIESVDNWLRPLDGNSHDSSEASS